MRTIFIAAFVSVVTTSGLAGAWDGPDMWYQSASGGPGGPMGPGGGGLIATGGARDHNVTCAHCHIKGDGTQGYGNIGASVTFDPPMGSNYKKGQTYQVTVALTNEHLGSPCTGGDPNMKNANGFAATFEDDSGKTSGLLSAEYGNAGSCPPALPSPFGGSVFTYSDCHAVIGRDESGSPTWTFNWTAPNDGANVTMYYGVVDGDCMMDSRGDDVKVGTVKLGAGIALSRPLRRVESADPIPPATDDSRAYAALALLPMAGLVMSMRRRPRRNDKR